MKILLVYPPFCSPASPPYSLVHLLSTLKAVLPTSSHVEILDLNIAYHNMVFPTYHSSFRQPIQDLPAFDKISTSFRRESEIIYARSNKSVVQGGNPDQFETMLALIKDRKPDIVALSIVYSSQAFYAHALIRSLHREGIKVILGGPAVNSKLQAMASCLHNSDELVSHLTHAAASTVPKSRGSALMDFTVCDWSDYWVPQPVLPIKTTSACYYQQCAFCSHHGKIQYQEFSLDNIRDSIVRSGVRHVFLLDDMIHRQRLLELAALFKPLNIRWMCQLRPTADLDMPTLQTLRDSGLSVIIWGVESGSDRVLALMNKGTNTADMARVLSESQKAGIHNAVFAMFGFPTETREEFLHTIGFLSENSCVIDLVSTSIFGLQADTPIFNNPAKYGITHIGTQPRTILEPSITYETSTGLSQQEASLMRKKFRRTLEKLNKYPKMMNFFREHLLIYA